MHILTTVIRCGPNVFFVFISSVQNLFYLQKLFLNLFFCTSVIIFGGTVFNPICLFFVVSSRCFVSAPCFFFFVFLSCLRLFFLSRDFFLRSFEHEIVILYAGGKTWRQAAPTPPGVHPASNGPNWLAHIRRHPTDITSRVKDLEQDEKTKPCRWRKKWKLWLLTTVAASLWRRRGSKSTSWLPPGTQLVFCVVFVFTEFRDEGAVAPRLSSNNCTRTRISSARTSVFWVQHLSLRCLGRRAAERSA